ncbi:hypothetical protein B0H63DRAFT_489011 [Podospora didyma]|uniref:Uncharacterized protein n=1 Tax=Podospora didyma TaxID=330526 RepID=A0AAE0N436_9PEZI|nr:hypothetical protein B0H63DRAFT_489011 [Podospora didyma]
MTLTVILSLVIAGVSGYCLFESAQSIPKLKTYEQRAEKAAEWSKAADERLWETRRTVAAGFIITSISLAASLYYMVFKTSGTAFIWAAVLAGAEVLSSAYIKSFWADKRKVPLLDDYNEAISHTQNVMGLADVLAVGWGVLAVLKVFGNKF